ncbi:LytR/AlgR family response regulator transcription factor [Flavivirga spongiicola]|uniref:LytTR family transcriptional regulator n=1 Tax=Flavivirga spongiicola TaxID=421621 RepID=A0ABU7XSZ2_9FLAO|nr:LytTR family DNA-binding domain-containing protein [Flavivirga sp. MEBiC05379]MDO5978568.1 LytTR family DNA-binding domain-containing protein [Flavivirga sp. MEBiC05379]
MFKQLNKNQKLVVHILFWVIYYVLFSLIWTVDDNYKDSFYLEFILLPIRILAVYFTIRLLIPKFLLKKNFSQFLFFYILSIVLLGFMQQGFIHFFYKPDAESAVSANFSVNSLVRAVILINSTVFFVATIYILNLYFLQREAYENIIDEQTKDDAEEFLKIELKSNRKKYLISACDIIYIEAMGNYVNYHIDNSKKITVYQSLKKCLNLLPNNFIRVHKSYIVNQKKIRSYDKEYIEVSNEMFIPVGSTFNIENISSI